MLIVFGVALAGVLVEAMLPNKYRRTVQPILAIARLRRRLVAVMLAARQA